MLPTLPPGAIIEIRAITGGVRRGELLVFAGDEVLVVHRLVGRRGDSLILQGDNRTVPDAPVHPEHLIGRVVRGWQGSTLIYGNSRVNIIAFLWILRYHALRILRFGIRHLRRRKTL